MSGQRRESPPAGLGERIVAQTFDLWIVPEVERRRSGTGAAVQLDQLRAAQVIFDPDAPGVEVRLDDEVRIVVRVRAGDAERAIGDVVDVEFDQVSELYLTEHDPNAGHITLLRFGDRWACGFNLVRNSSRMSEHLDAAEEFLEAAEGSLERQQLRALSENLYGAAELIAKATLLSLPGRRVLDSKTHGVIHSDLNRLGRSPENVDPDFVRAFNELSELRRSARYLQKPFSLTAQRAAEMTAVTRRVLADLRDSTPEVVAIRAR